MPGPVLLDDPSLHLQARYIAYRRPRGWGNALKYRSKSTNPKPKPFKALLHPKPKPFKALLHPKPKHISPEPLKQHPCVMVARSEAAEASSQGPGRGPVFRV